MKNFKYGRDIPEFVRNFRARYDLTQADLGHRLGVHAQYVSNIEREVHENPIQFCSHLLDILNPEEAEYLIELVNDITSDIVFKKLTLAKTKRKTLVRKKS